jgi:hypothetical protein
MKQNTNEINGEINEQSFFHLFKVNINEFWNYFMNPSFVPTYFYENCKITNIKDINGSLKENDVLELFYKDKNLKAKLLIENVIDTQNYKSVSFKLIDHPDDMAQFTAIDSFYFCSQTNTTGLLIKIIIHDKEKKNFVLDYWYENKGTIYKDIEKYIEINFKETEETESISIGKSGNEVFDFLTTKNYTNLKILLGNNASIKPTNNPNEIEVEHFTKNNRVKFMISKSIDFNEKQLLIQLIESQIQIPRQSIIVKIININKDESLVTFTHKIKEYISNELIMNYSVLKKKLLWLLKSTIEGK